MIYQLLVYQRVYAASVLNRIVMYTKYEIQRNMLSAKECDLFGLITNCLK